MENKTYQKNSIKTQTIKNVAIVAKILNFKLQAYISYKTNIVDTIICEKDNKHNFVTTCCENYLY